MTTDCVGSVAIDVHDVLNRTTPRRVYIGENSVLGRGEVMETVPGWRIASVDPWHAPSELSMRSCEVA